MEERLKSIEKQLLELQTNAKSVNKKKDKTPRAPSEYNTFMGKYIKDQKDKLGSEYDHKKAFKDGAAAWKENGKSKEKS